MSFHACNFCQKTGPDASDPEEAKRQAEAAGFELIWIPTEDPVAEKVGPGLMRLRVLCAYCAKFVKTHFVVATATTAADVLDPDDPDFETDTDW